MEVDVKVTRASFDWRETDEGDVLVVTVPFSEEETRLIKPMFEGVVHVDMTFYAHMLDGDPYIVVQLNMGSGSVHLWFGRSDWRALGEEPDEITLKFGEEGVTVPFFGKRLGMIIDAWLEAAEDRREGRAVDAAIDPAFLQALEHTFS
ncbi:MAG: hypothetical protein BSOLF_0500 [Candidatus Carbobacillus altaicus]|uniref:Uncharacterized protein n=1 Tax=Candidatus Carbonibacillus altaicus TaxID=2163959 RepID=A0A2R6Y0R4_9BACL|nr:MAG: hypothetical protein BSOLF_0500 [Candidatus Carbobacillus altaicus]